MSGTIHPAALAHPGHNLPPVVAPNEADALADLKRRYPEIETKLAEFEKALKDYPETLTLADEDVAAALQDTLGQIKKEVNVWKAHKKSEKAPWAKIVNVVQNFFTTPEDKADKWLEEWRPRHQQFLDLKRDENERIAREQAEAQAREAERLKKEALEAEERKAKAEAERIAAEKAEQEARERAAAEEQRARDAKARADQLKTEEEEAARKKRDADRAEKARNEDGLRQLKAHLKTVERLNVLCDSDESTDEDVIALDSMIAPNGVISRIAGPIDISALLDEEQRAAIDAIRVRLTELRTASNARFTKREQKKREKARLEHEAALKREADEREAARKADEEAAAARFKERQAAEREAEEANARKLAATEQVRDAREDQREARAEEKGAARQAQALATDADRAQNRGDRIVRRLEKSTDADLSRTRGELGTVGSLTGRWTRQIVDEVALRAVCGPLGEHLNTTALEGATFHWMRAHQNAWTTERVEAEELPGVVFIWERDTVIA